MPPLKVTLKGPIWNGFRLVMGWLDGGHKCLRGGYGVVTGRYRLVTSGADGA